MSSRCLSVLALLFFAASAQAGGLRVCAEPDNPPFSSADGSGFENRLARLAAQALGKPLRYVWAPQRFGFVRKTFGARLCDAWMGVPAGFAGMLTTEPYYRSSYVFITSHAALPSFDDPNLRRLRIGVQLPPDDFGTTPPGYALALRGAIDNVVGFPLAGRRTSGQRIVDAIAAGQLDAGVAWGPAAAFFARQRKLHVRLARPPAGLAWLPFQFSISIGVRSDEPALRDSLNAVLERRREAVEAILDAYAVPRVPERAD